MELILLGKSTRSGNAASRLQPMRRAHSCKSRGCEKGNSHQQTLAHPLVHTPAQAHGETAHNPADISAKVHTVP